MLREAFEPFALCVPKRADLFFSFFSAIRFPESDEKAPPSETEDGAP
jgi:hypothetical protein